MTEEIEDGGPAFACGDHTHGGQGGMSLRDWFAGQALTGMLADPNSDTDLTFATIASDCYSMADAMLKARKGK